MHNHTYLHSITRHNFTILTIVKKYASLRGANTISSLLLFPNSAFHFEKLIHFSLWLAKTIIRFLNFSHSDDLLASTVQSESMCCKKKCKKVSKLCIVTPARERFKSQRCLHICIKAPKISRPLSCMVVKWMYINDGVTFQENSYNWEAECEGEDRHSSTTSACS